MPTFNLSQQQVTMLIIGISVVVGLYVLIKVISWAIARLANSAKGRTSSHSKSHAQSQVKGAQLRQSDESRVERPQSAPAVQSLSREVPVEKKAVVNHPTVAREPKSAPADLRKTHVASEFSVAVAQTERSHSLHGNSLWLTESRKAEQKNLFEDVGAEYPYATGDDYRYGPITPVLSELLPTSEEGRKETTRVLRNAGYFEPHAWQNFAAFRYLAIMVPLIVVGVLLVVSPARFEPLLVGLLVIAPALGWALPSLFIQSKAQERLREIELAMPDMLDLLNMCVSQGMNVIQALARISREFSGVYPALSKELQIVSEQARVGSLTQALNNFSSRVDVPEVHSFTSLLIQTEQMGTSVSDALVDYSDSMRESQRQRADEKANNAAFKLLFPTVLCLMPAVFLLLMGPPLIELNRFFHRGGVGGLNQQAMQELEERSAPGSQP